MKKESQLLSETIRNLSEQSNENITELEVMSALEDARDAEQAVEDLAAFQSKRKANKLPKLSTHENIKLVMRDVVQNVINDRTFYHDLDNSTKISDVARWAKDYAGFTATEDIGNLLEWLFNTIADIKKTCSNGDVDTNYQDKSQLIINSVVKGSGKSRFVEALIEQAQKAGIEACYQKEYPLGGFYNGKEESRNLIMGYKERKTQVVDETTLQNIGRREEYVYCEKGKMPMNLKSRAITIGTTNGYTYCKDDRAFLEIQCLPATWQVRLAALTNRNKLGTNFQNQVTHCNTMIYNMNTEKFVKFVSFFKLVKLNKINKFISCQETKKLYKLSGIAHLELLKNLLQDCTVNYEMLSFISVKGFAKYYRSCTSRDLTFNQQQALAECFTQLWTRGLCKARGPRSDFQRQYNLFDLREAILNFEEDLEEYTLEDKVLEADDEWNRIIAEIEKWENENTPDDGAKSTFLNETDAVLPDGYSFCNKFDKETTFENKMQEQVVINRSVRDYPSRKGEDVKGNNFLCECDDISKEEQKELIENLPQKVKDSVIYVCDSGNKSIHLVLQTTCQSTDSRIRRKVLEHISKKYFKGHLDMNTINASRLARNPNAIRENGQKQQCLYMNLKPSCLNVDDIVDRELREIEAAKSARALWRATATKMKSANERKPLNVVTLKSFRQTPGRDKAIEMLYGTCDWSGMCTACMYLLNIWNDDEIISAVGVDDKWINKALIAAHARLGY